MEKRQRPVNVRPIVIPSPAGSARSKKKRRANESPLTFIRSGHHHTGSHKPKPLSSSSSSWIERSLFFFEESVACLNSDSGTQYRSSIYGLAPMLEHEQFDTMGIRKVRNLFASVPAGVPSPDLPPPAALPDLTSSTEEDEDEAEGLQFTSGVPMAAVPRLDSEAYAERSYLLRLALAEEPVAMISIEHAIEELLERCPFLRDPASTWICRPGKLHVLLATTASTNVTREERECTAVVKAAGPVRLKLHRFMWRRQGTLWVQWHCIDGNVDRLRADLRLASRGTVSQCFTGSPEDVPSLGRPFAVETLVMAILQKPTREEFSQLMHVTSEMQRMFEGVTAGFNSVVRVAQIHDRLDRDAVNGEESIIPLAPRIDQKFEESFVDKLAHAYHLAKTSPSVRRVAFSAFLSSSLVASIAVVFICRKFR